MGLMSLISREKEKFRGQQRLARMGIEEYGKKNEAQREAEKLQALRAETIKAEGIAKLRHEEAQLKERLSKAKSPSNVQKFGQGLAKVVNKAKSDVSSAKKAGYFKGLGIGAPRSTVGSGIQQETRNVFGGNPIQTGGNKPGGVFLMGDQPKPKAERRPQVTIRL